MLGLAGMAFLGVEKVSSGHRHLEAGKVVFHHHLYFESHEHPDAQPDRDHEMPDSQDRGTPQRTATVSVASALSQPVAAIVPVPPSEAWSSSVAAPTPFRVAQPAIQPAGPRGPPFPSEGSDAPPRLARRGGI